jgi:hypothetical protein
MKTRNILAYRHSAGYWRWTTEPDDGRPIPMAIVIDDLPCVIPVAEPAPKAKAKPPEAHRPTQRSIDPAAFRDYRVAKRLAAELAAELGLTLVQSPNGKPRIITGSGGHKDCETWLAAYSWLFQLRADRVKK